MKPIVSVFPLINKLLLIISNYFLQIESICKDYFGGGEWG